MIPRAGARTFGRPRPGWGGPRPCPSGRDCGGRSLGSRVAPPCRVSRSRRRKPGVSIAPPPDSLTTDGPRPRAIVSDAARAAAPSSIRGLARPQARGKFIFAGDAKFYVRGVTYGAFRPDASGREYREVDYIERLYRAVKEEDPGGLVTYVNYPTTEYLQLPCLDLVCFNVYLESQDRFEAYLARLQNLAGDRPLLMSELGLDGLRHDEGVQARSLAWQVRSAFAAGCAGVFVFAWTDEWYRQGHDVEDWAFGL